MLIFAAAGHHAAYLLPADNIAWPALPLHTQNPIVGMLPDPEITTAEVAVPLGSTLHLFSDGVFEVIDREGRQLGLDDILPMLSSATSPYAGLRVPRRRRMSRRFCMNGFGQSRGRAILTTIFRARRSASHNSPNAPRCRLLGRFPSCPDGRHKWLSHCAFC